MDSSKKRITLSFSVPSGGNREPATRSRPPSTQTQSPATGSHQKENMRPTDESRPKTFMDNWIEPPLRPPAPSFTDYPHLRIERHGVLEGMAPLGTLPSAKVKKLVKQEALSKRSAANMEESDASTSASTPREMRTPEPPINTIVRRSYSREGDNAEWTPQPQASIRKSESRTPRPQASAQRSERPSESPFATREERALEQTDKAVQIAVEDAIHAGKWPTAYALRTLYNDYKENPRIRRLFMRIFTRQASKDEQKEFTTLIAWKKKQGSKNRTAQKYFDDNDNIYTSNATFAPSVSASASTKDKAEATVRGASTSTPTSPHKQNTTHASKKPKVNHDDQLISRNGLSSNSEATTNGLPAPNDHRSPSQRHLERNHVAHSPRTEHDSDAIPTANMAQGESSAARLRASSISSSSSLSSLDEAFLGGFESPVKKTADLRLNEAPRAKEVSERKAANSAEKPGRNHNERQPITRHDEHVHKLSNFTAVNSASSSNTPTPNAPDSSSSNIQRNGDNVMHAFSAEPYSFPPSLPSNLPQPPPIKLSKKTAASAAAAAAKKAGSYSPRDADIIRRKKQVKSRAEKEYQAQRDSSFVRTPVSVPEPESEREAAETVAVAPQPIIKPILRFRPRPAGDDSDVQSSPTRLTFKLDFEPESAKNSRASTPTGASRASRKARNPGPRMKSSPQKKALRASTAFGRSDHDRQFSPSTGEHGQDDNDDFCSSCGGSGDLVCCDGCTRSFHLRCVDPPMDQKDLPDQWFCNVCVAQRKGVTAHTGLFGKLITQLEKKNPHAFCLPKEIREYFDGVRTGPEGEYEDSPPPKKGKHEEQDLYRLYDKKGEPVLCHVCARASGGKMPIITCSYCGLSWHLDCLDPPLANPPGNGPTRPWKCPCHVDDLLAKASKKLGPAHKFRKVKGRPTIKPELKRGVKNQGHIEVELAPSDDEGDGDFVEEREFGRVYVLPEEGIKLDFISRVHQSRREAGREQAESEAPTVRLPTPPLAMNEHSLQEQQAALNLAALLGSGEREGGSMRALTDAMVAGLSGTGAVEIIAKGSVAKLLQNEGQANDADLSMLDLIIQMGKEAEAKKAKALAHTNGAAVGQNADIDMDVDVDMDSNVVSIKRAPSSSPAPQIDEAVAMGNENESGAKRKLGGKDGFLHAEQDEENRERVKRSRSR